jgi:hypothetical protein
MALASFAVLQYFWTLGGIADKQGQLALPSSAAFDPTATLAVHCGNGFDADFNLYRSARLGR